MHRANNVLRQESTRKALEQQESDITLDELDLKPGAPVKFDEIGILKIKVLILSDEDHA